jgi:hypothetical protein
MKTGRVESSFVSTEVLVKLDPQQVIIHGEEEITA